MREVRKDFKRTIKIIYNSYMRQVRKNSETHIIFLGKISAPSAQWFWYMYQIFLTRISAPSAQGFWGMDQIFFSPWLVRQVRKDFGRWIKSFLPWLVRQMRKDFERHIDFQSKISAPSGQWFWEIHEKFCS